MASDNVHFEAHTLQKFDDELNRLLTQMLEMGGLVQKQLSDALDAIEQMDSELADQVEEAEETVNKFEVDIDRTCANIIAMRQPAASDLRMILAIGKVVRDLERIGDEAAKVAQIAKLIIEDDSKSIGTLQVRHVGGYVQQMLKQVLDAYSRFDVDEAVMVARKDDQVDEEYRGAMRELVTHMMEDPRKISQVLNLMWAIRSLERIGDHATNVAEQLIYSVRGVDVRHTSLKQLRKRVKRSRLPITGPENPFQE